MRLGLPDAIEQWVPRPHSVYISVLPGVTRWTSRVRFALERNATAAIAMLLVPAVTAGALGTTATSWAPFGRRYCGETWAAISFAIAPTVPGCGFQLGHGGGGEAGGGPHAP